MKNCSNFLITVSGLAVALAVTPCVANAQEASGEQTSGGGLEEIVVVAQKRAENLQKVPIAITSVSQEAIVQANVKSVQDLPALVPGLVILNNANQMIPRIRGVGAGYATVGLEAPVATFIDGVYRSFTSDTYLNFYDVAQVDALKGPQGTLFGRNATGGVLQITTREPKFNFGGSFQTSIDNYLTSNSNLFVTGPLSDNVAASMSASFKTQGNGWGTNIATGHDTFKIKHAVDLRGKLKAKIGDDTVIDIVADYGNTAGPTGINLHVAPGYSTAFPTPQPKNPYDISRDQDTVTSLESGGLSIKVSHNFDFANLSSISAYRSARNSFLFANIATTPKLTVLDLTYRSKQFTEEVQLVSNSSSGLRWSIGAFYFYNKATARFDLTNNGPLLTTTLMTSFPGVQTAKSIAGFAQATYDILPTTRLTAGFRYTHDQRKFDGQTIRTPNPAAPPIVLVNTHAGVTTNKPTWRLALDHDLTQDVMLYASYNRGSKSGGFNTISATSPAFDPEKLDAYEAGVKSQLFDRRLRLNIGGFYYDYSNIQVPIFTGGPTLIRNAASAESYGVEGDLAAKITDQLQLNASAAWVHARFKSFKNAPFNTPKANFQGATPIVGDASGYTLPHTPTFTANISVNYDIPTANGTYKLALSDSYNSGYYTEIDNVLRQDSFHYLNASVGWDSADENFGVRLFVNNILDEAVFSQGTTTPSSYHVDYTNPPLTFGGSIKIAF